MLRGRENLSHEELSPTKGHEVASTNRRLFVEATSPDDFGPFPELPVVRKSGRQAADATTRIPIGRAADLSVSLSTSRRNQRASVHDRGSSPPVGGNPLRRLVVVRDGSVSVSDELSARTPELPRPPVPTFRDGPPEEAGHSNPDEPLQHGGLEQDDQKDDDQNDNEDAGSYVHAEPPFGCGHSLTTTHLYRPEFNLKRPIHRDPIELYANMCTWSRTGRPTLASVAPWTPDSVVGCDGRGRGRARRLADAGYLDREPTIRAGSFSPSRSPRLALNLSFGFEDVAGPSRPPERPTRSQGSAGPAHALASFSPPKSDSGPAEVG